MALEFTGENLLKTAERYGIQNKVEKHLDDEALRKGLDFPKGYGRLFTAWNGWLLTLWWTDYIAILKRVT